MPKVLERSQDIALRHFVIWYSVEVFAGLIVSLDAPISSVESDYQLRGDLLYLLTVSEDLTLNIAHDDFHIRGNDSDLH